jgi:hypothetical protein
MAELSTPTAPLTRIPFTARSEASIAALSKWMRVAAAVGILSAAGRIVSVFGPRHDFGQLIGAVISLLMGIWTYQAADAFNRVATTDTADQTYLMKAFTLLRRVFLLQALLVFVTLALLVVLFLGAAAFMVLRP